LHVGLVLRVLNVLQILEIFKVTRGVRQGGVLSTYLFACFIDDVVDKVYITQARGLGCHIGEV